MDSAFGSGKDITELLFWKDAPILSAHYLAHRNDIVSHSTVNPEHSSHIPEIPSSHNTVFELTQGATSGLGRWNLSPTPRLDSPSPSSTSATSVSSEQVSAPQQDQQPEMNPLQTLSTNRSNDLWNWSTSYTINNERATNSENILRDTIPVASDYLSGRDKVLPRSPYSSYLAPDISLTSSSNPLLRQSSPSARASSANNNNEDLITSSLIGDDTPLLKKMTSSSLSQYLSTSKQTTAGTKSSLMDGTTNVHNSFNYDSLRSIWGSSGLPVSPLSSSMSSLRARLTLGGGDDGLGTNRLSPVSTKSDRVLTTSNTTPVPAPNTSTTQTTALIGDRRTSLPNHEPSGSLFVEVKTAVMTPAGSIQSLNETSMMSVTSSMSTASLLSNHNMKKSAESYRLSPAVESTQPGSVQSAIYSKSPSKSPQNGTLAVTSPAFGSGWGSSPALVASHSHGKSPKFSSNNTPTLINNNNSSSLYSSNIQKNFTPLGSRKLPAQSTTTWNSSDSKDRRRPSEDSLLESPTHSASEPELAALAMDDKSKEDEQSSLPAMVGDPANKSETVPSTKTQNETFEESSPPPPAPEPRDSVGNRTGVLTSLRTAAAASSSNARCNQVTEDEEFDELCDMLNQVLDEGMSGHQETGRGHNKKGSNGSQWDWILDDTEEDEEEPLIQTGGIGGTSVDVMPEGRRPREHRNSWSCYNETYETPLDGTAIATDVRQFQDQLYALEDDAKRDSVSPSPYDETALARHAPDESFDKLLNSSSDHFSTNIKAMTSDGRFDPLLSTDRSHWVEASEFTPSCVPVNPVAVSSSHFNDSAFTALNSTANYDESYYSSEWAHDVDDDDYEQYIAELGADGYELPYDPTTGEPTPAFLAALGDDPSLWDTSYLEEMGWTAAQLIEHQANLTDESDPIDIPLHNFKITSRADSRRHSGRKPCTFFLEGNCRRTDCRYSHDLSRITCKYWLEGFCYKDDLCPFRHAQPDPNEIIDESPSALISGRSYGKDYRPGRSPMRNLISGELVAEVAARRKKDFKLESEADFPTLSGSLNERDASMGGKHGMASGSLKLSPYTTALLSKVKKGHSDSSRPKNETVLTSPDKCPRTGSGSKAFTEPSSFPPLVHSNNISSSSTASSHLNITKSIIPTHGCLPAHGTDELATSSRKEYISAQTSSLMEELKANPRNSHVAFKVLKKEKKRKKQPNTTTTTSNQQSTTNSVNHNNNNPPLNVLTRLKGSKLDSSS